MVQIFIQSDTKNQWMPAQEWQQAIICDSEAPRTTVHKETKYLVLTGHDIDFINDDSISHEQLSLCTSVCEHFEALNALLKDMIDFLFRFPTGIEENSKDYESFLELFADHMGRVFIDLCKRVENASKKAVSSYGNCDYTKSLRLFEQAFGEMDFHEFLYSSPCYKQFTKCYVSVSKHIGKFKDGSQGMLVNLATGRVRRYVAKNAPIEEDTYCSHDGASKISDEETKRLSDLFD